MYYTFITKNTPKQLTFTEIFNNYHNPSFFIPRKEILTTHTVKQETLTDAQKTQLYNKYKIREMQQKLLIYENTYQGLLLDNMTPHYDTFYIPKHSGGLRRIDAPKQELMFALKQMQLLFENNFHTLAHNAAYAYVKTRSTVDALQKHQKHKSRWFLKLDIKNFFPNCTETLIMAQLQKIFPFNLICEDPEAHHALQTCVKLCLLNEVLPQGTPMSPLLTNLIMVPIDDTLTKLTQNNPFNQHFCYTRYADDLLISCEFTFDWKKVQNKVQAVLKAEGTPFKLKREKTRYGSSAGSNWNLGLMLNKDNNITIGHKQKQRLKATIFAFLKDLTDGVTWSRIDVQTLLGNISYYKKVEPDYIDHVIRQYNTKFHKNLEEEIKEIIRQTI